MSKKGFLSNCYLSRSVCISHSECFLHTSIYSSLVLSLNMSSYFIVKWIFLGILVAKSFNVFSSLGAKASQKFEYLITLCSPLSNFQKNIITSSIVNGTLMELTAFSNYGASNYPCPSLSRILKASIVLKSGHSLTNLYLANSTSYSNSTSFAIIYMMSKSCQ